MADQETHDVPTSPTTEDAIEITLTHGGSSHTIVLPRDATIVDLSAAVEAELSDRIGHETRKGLLAVRRAPGHH